MREREVQADKETTSVGAREGERKSVSGGVGE